MDQGEVIIRPSSKGADHLTITWKVADGIYQHIDVREEGKANAFSLGNYYNCVELNFSGLYSSYVFLKYFDLLHKVNIVLFLGKSLWIGNEEFEDLDEIIARHVTPMASHARDLLNFRYFKDIEGQKDKADEYLKEERKKNSSKIHYVVSASKVILINFLHLFLGNNVMDQRNSTFPQLAYNIFSHSRRKNFVNKI